MSSDVLFEVLGLRSFTHDEHDDLLSGGLGWAGLRSAAPSIAQAAAPTWQEQRRRALWANWRGMADLFSPHSAAAQGRPLPRVAGTEVHALLRVSGARWPHRVMVQIPRNFNHAQPLLVVSASAGSRGVFGAVPVASHWALSRGHAVVTTDKAAGTDWLDVVHGGGLGLPGDVDIAASCASYATSPQQASAPSLLAIKHAHSGDHPEADWGQHVAHAAAFGTDVVCDVLKAGGQPLRGRLRTLGLAMSNGAAAVLRAAGGEAPWLEGVVAACPNVWAGEGGRALFDYGSEAALWMPPALLAAGWVPALQSEAARVQAEVLGVSPQEAAARLIAAGWTDAALCGGMFSVQADLWRLGGAGYASAYLRRGPDAMPAGYHYRVVDASGGPRASTPAERMAWTFDSAGMPPFAGVALCESRPGAEARVEALCHLRELAIGSHSEALTAQASAQATRAALPRRDLPIVLLHGAGDGLVPEAFSSGPYARWLRDAGCALDYTVVPDAQHFDPVVALPEVAGRYRPLLPLAHQAMDALWARLRDT